MCTFIALEKRNEGGFWTGYFGAVPERFGTPGYFSAEEWEVLKGTNLEFAWRDREQVWKEECQRVKSVIPDLQW
jgi:hypothetical protein